MPKTLDNSDDLEALLADLSDDDFSLLDEPAKPAAQPVIEAEPAPVVEKAKRTRKPKAEVAPEPVAAAAAEEEINLDDLDDLTLDEPKPAVSAELIELAVETGLIDEDTAVALSEPVVKIETTPDDEIDALLAAAEETAPVVIYTDPTPTVKVTAPRYEEKEERFVPESDLRTFIDIDRLKADLDFTETNISLAMTRQASLFAHYSTLAHQAQFQADRADQQVDLIEAQLDQKYRDAFVTAGQKITENMIKAAIIKDEKYQKAMLRKNESKAIAEMVKSAADSFRHRRDMLIQVGADLRQQAQGNVHTKEHPGQAALDRLSARA